MAIKHSITLSTTEPNNEVGVIKIRQADEQTQTLEVQITENGVPKSYQGLAVYFCAKLGQTAGLGIIEQKLKLEEMTSPANGKLEYTMRAEDWQILGRQRGYFSFRLMLDEHEFIDQFTTRDFTFEVIKSVYSDGLKEVKKDGSTYVWTIEDIVRLLKEYVAAGKMDWEEFVEQNREVLESVDPGGKLIGELIDARRPFGGEAYATLGERLDESEAQLKNIAVSVSDLGAVGDGVTLDYNAFKKAIDIIRSCGGGTVILEPDKKYLLFDGSQPFEKTVRGVNSLFGLSNINKFKIEGNGSELLFYDVNYQSDVNLFTFENSKNICVENLTLRGNNNVYPNIQARVNLFHFLNHTTGVQMTNLNGENIRGFIHCDYETNVNLPTILTQTKQIIIKNVTGNVVKYAFLFAFNGCGVTINNVKLNKVHRGYFAYGVSDHDVEIEVDNFDATGGMIKSYASRGCENITVKVKSHNNNDINTPVNTPTFELSYGDAGNATHRNINVNLDIKNAKNNNGFIFRYIGEIGGVSGDFKHELDTLKLSGCVDVVAGGAIRFIKDNDLSWGNLTFKDISLIDLKIRNQKSGSNINLDALVGNALFKNIEITGDSAHLYIDKVKNDGEYNIIISECIASSLSQLSFNARATYINSVVRYADFHNHDNKRYVNTWVEGKLYNRIDTSHFEPTLKSEQKLWWFNQDNIISQSEKTALGNLTNYVFKLKINENITQVGSRNTQPNLFDFQLFVQNASGTRFSIVKGSLFLRSSTSSQTAVSIVYLIDHNVFEVLSGVNLVLDSVVLTGSNEIGFSLSSSSGGIDNVGGIILV